LAPLGEQAYRIAVETEALLEFFGESTNNSSPTFTTPIISVSTAVVD